MPSITKSQSNLTQLLSLASTLHQRDDLSLQQLVPVHESLCQALFVDDNESNNNSSAVTSLEDAIASLVNENDVKSATLILKEGTEAQQLVVLQFLVRSMDSLQALGTCIVPFLLQHAQASEGLREALLDAVLVNSSSSLLLDWLKTVFEACHVTEISQWNVVCRVLVRLYNDVVDSSLKSQTNNFLYEQVLQGFQQSLVSDDYMKVLNPIVTWLLPLLVEQDDGNAPKRVDELWTCLLATLSSEAPKNQQVALVVSAILCSILPSLVTTELPVISNETTRALPVNQSLLWNLILYSLQQGMDSTSLKGSGFQTSQVINVDQMLRRRGLYLLRLLVESFPNNKKNNNSVWLKYILCFEALEMETEPHLVEQVWDTVAEICSLTASSQQTCLPAMTWEWISAMLARVLLSDTLILRKLGLYRFLGGHVGINVSSNNEEQDSDKPSLLTPGQTRHAVKSKKKKGTAPSRLAPISLVSEDFVLNILIPSYDTLSQSLGTNVHVEEHGRTQVQDVSPLFSSFLSVYVSALDTNRRRVFLRGLFSPFIVCNVRLKTTVMIYEAVASVNVPLPIDQELLQTAIKSFGMLVTGVSIVVAYQERLMVSYATMLSRSIATDAIDPEVLLKTLSFYPVSSPPRATGNGSDECINFLNDDCKYEALQTWLAKLGNSPSWATLAGSACASAFVMGQLFPPTSEWSPEFGSSETERNMGFAIVLLCTLAAASEKSNASELLWPAIHKGLISVPEGYPWHNASRTFRSFILLENGCRLGVLSGIGNGDLVMDKSQKMMPPPPNIEHLLANAVAFDLAHIKALTSLEGDQATATSGNLRSGNTARVSSMLAHLVSQMQTLCNGYPSSLAISRAADGMLKLSMEKLADGESLSGAGVVQNMALAFGALSCGADPNDVTSGIESCRFILNMEFSGTIDRNVSKQVARSVFQYAKWGTLSALLDATDTSQDSRSSQQTLLTELFNVAEDSVHATPADALLPLFDCVVKGARKWMLLENDENGSSTDVYTEKLTKVINALFALKSEVTAGRSVTYMLNEICSLLFRPTLLMEEYKRWERDGSDAAMPIRDAFRGLMEMAGSNRPHISRIALSYMSVAWLGVQSDDDGDISVSLAGLSAIPYRRDICNLLLHKELKIEESAAVQETNLSVGPAELPSGIDDASIARGFVLMFLSRLADATDGLPQQTLTELVHFVISYLLDEICLALAPGGANLMLGSIEYNKKIRAWQALCVLSRFVTEDIAKDVCEKVFECTSQNLHGQIRYFLEAFAIQCTRRHPSIFGRELVRQIRRTDLSIQNVSTLMIVIGNMVVGRYKDEFMQQFDSKEQQRLDFKEILAGTIPWLGSTQGFSRAIAQLLVHKLVPLTIDMNASNETNLDNSDWFLQSVYKFLNENIEMTRLRKKQSKFFDQYDVDDICLAESLLKVGVDEGSEANPNHMVEAIKKCLEQVYLEAHESELPEWKQVANMMEGMQISSATQDTEEEELVNFQRKIIPLDSLELDLEASRDVRLKNARGRKKQKLLVCASLVDKVPNLAGLARSCEIFAAERLVIPDPSVCCMDNFKSISVGAGEWMDIEGCKENQLLNWLRKQKERGYTIVGVEQTSSSMSLSEYKFSDQTVLLLGKEKEGIPVEFLQVVDVCVEIPQLGVIRSLNVHVTGALAIWEYTKQMLEQSN